MPFVQKTSNTELFEYLEAEVKKREDKIVNVLKYVGEQCVNEARTNGSYQDQTGNLRSSIGYVVVKNGIVAGKSGFPIVKKGSEGQTEGQKFLQEKILEYSQGIVLIVVAGMNYAYYVEKKEYNVLSSAELLAKRKVPQMLKQLGFTMK